MLDKISHPIHGVILVTRHVCIRLRLEGKVVIITGGASGIGEAASRLFAAEGAAVVIADIQDKLGTAVAASIGSSCSFTHCDVTDEHRSQRRSPTQFAPMGTSTSCSATPGSCLVEAPPRQSLPCWRWT